MKYHCIQGAVVRSIWLYGCGTLQYMWPTKGCYQYLTVTASAASYTWDPEMASTPMHGNGATASICVIPAFCESLEPKRPSTPWIQGIEVGLNWCADNANQSALLSYTTPFLSDLFLIPTTPFYFTLIFPLQGSFSSADLTLPSLFNYVRTSVDFFSSSVNLCLHFISVFPAPNPRVFALYKE